MSVECLEVLDDFVMIEPTKAPSLQGKIIIPDEDDVSEMGQVVAFGPGRLDDNNERIPIDLQVGDIVLFPKTGCKHVTYGGRRYTMTTEQYVTAVLKK